MSAADGTALLSGRRERSGFSARDGDGDHAWVWTLYAAFGFLLFAYAVSLLVRPNGETWTWLDGWGTAAFELSLTALVFARALAVPRDKSIGLMLGFGMAAWALGDFAMTIESLGGATPPTPSAADVFWAGFFPFAYVGVMLLVRREVRRFSLANWLDGIVAGLGAAAVFAAFAFQGVVKSAGGSALSVATNLIYPVGDVLLLMLVVAVIAVLPGERRGRWWLMGTACAINAAGDISALFPAGIGATQFGFFANAIAWPASLFLFSISMWLPSIPAPVDLTEKSSGFVVPGVAASAALLILFVGSLRDTGRVALALATVTLIVAGVRVAFSLLHLRSLADERHRQLTGDAQSERDSREALQAAVRGYSEFAARVAEGDLTAVAAASESGDLEELSESLNTMVNGLSDISSQVHAGVADIRISTAEILASVSQHTQSASQQSSAISETSTTVDEVRTAADLTARKASEVAERARASVHVSDDGTRAVEAIASAMEEIRERVDGIARDVRTLSERTQEIGAITSTVNDLADRSNLLALNASVEAARAGEHGAGFAVVATEVRDMAEQSKAATSQVERILRDVQIATTAAVLATEQGTKVVEQGLQLTGRAGDGIHSLAETIRTAADAAQEIAASAHQQSVGMDQIAESMIKVKEGTTAQFLAGAERSQKAAEDLNDLSAKLAAITQRYQLGASS
jgi:methyl-accepting chemotaxis protein